jgi:HEAT repeat protein
VVAGVLESRDPELFHELIEALAASCWADPLFVRPLVAVADGSDCPARAAAVRALGVQDDPRAAAAVLRALAPGEGACEFLGSPSPGTMVRPPSPWAAVRVEAAKAAGWLQAAEAVEPLLGLLACAEAAGDGDADAADWFVGEMVAALGTIGDARALAPLVGLARRRPGIGALPAVLAALVRQHAAGAGEGLLRDVLRLEDGTYETGVCCLVTHGACYDDAKDEAEAELRRRGVRDDPLFAPRGRAADLAAFLRACESEEGQEMRG